MTIKSVPPQIWACGYLLGILVTFVAVGWVLSAYAAPTLMWIWTLILIAYIAWAGAGAIAMAMLWVVSVVWVAAYTTATPTLMNWKGPSWALSLVGVWIFAISVVLILALARPALQSLSWPRKSTFYRLIVITWAGLIVGRFLYLELLPSSTLSMLLSSP